MTRWAGKREVRIVGPDTDLTLSIAGRTFINDDGRKNMPGGDIFTGPVEDSAEGRSVSPTLATHGGKAVADIRLRFAEGRVVEARAGRTSVPESSLATDRSWREVASASSPSVRIRGITRSRERPLRRKDAGTVHLALGVEPTQRPVATTSSAMHWDMICDLRDGGGIWVDGKLFAVGMGGSSSGSDLADEAQAGNAIRKSGIESARCHGGARPPGQRAIGEGNAIPRRVRA